MSKFVKSIDINEEQPLNIADMSRTFEVSKFEKFIDINEEHPSNIEPILITFEVSKFDRSTDNKKLHSQNNPSNSLDNVFEHSIVTLLTAYGEFI